MANINRVPNRLIHEKSPYLQQHAYNPVDWYPWGEEAFDKAKAEDKPVFLSIGYSTCHWCHVMERESFEDEEIADILNKYYVSIKVDREERPDIDHIYMEVCQLLTGNGGWPLSVFLDPDKKPFYAGTYFPKESRYNMVGFKNLLIRLHELWSSNRQKISRAASQILDIIDVKYEDGGEINKDILNIAFKQYRSIFDSQYGGFSHAPKFPAPHNLLFLLRYYKNSKNTEALQMVEKTLSCMHRGGIYDHIGFGFSRYSTDNKWLVPHFEKMLYDNALIAIVLSECYLITENNYYKDILEYIFKYIKREMTSPEGGFYSAQDADSEGVEGKFYVWSPEEIKRVLGERDGEEFCRLYDITEKGNFEGKSIPNLIDKPLPENKKDFAVNAISKLYKEREKRIHPFKDDKILTSWNGLMIASLAIGYMATKNKEYLSMAEKAADFILKNLVDNKGRLMARYRDNEAKYLGIADDYVFVIWGLLELYKENLNSSYLKKAIEFNNILIDEFWDSERGGLYLNSEKCEKLITRPKTIYDGAIPSANSVCARNFWILSLITGDINLNDMAYDIFKCFSQEINESPISHAFSLIALQEIWGGSKKILITAKRKKDLKEMTDIIYEYDLSLVTLLAVTDDDKIIKSIVKDYDNYIFEDKPVAYICEGQTCKPPISDLNILREELN